MSTNTATRAQLDRRLTQAAYPLDEDTVEAILYSHGPRRWGGHVCRACGYLYTPTSPDCPSVTVAITTAHTEGQL